MTIASTPQACKYPRKLFTCVSLFILLLGLALIVPAGTGHAAQVTLAWDRNAESDIAGYRVYYGTGSRAYNLFFDVGNATTYSVTGLTDGRTYYFAATAYDSSGLESVYSSEVSKSTCTYSISSPGASFSSAGGTGSVNVTTQSSCVRTASSGASWLTITSGGSGTGSGTVQYSVAANTSASPRTASSTIAGNVFTVTQAGTSSSTFTITASSGANGTVSPAGTSSVTSGAAKTYTITPNSGYRVASVLVDGASVGAVTTYTFSNVRANHRISATFAANTTNYTITGSCGSGGTISPAGAVTVASGTSKAFTITPNSGYKVASILVDGASVGAVTTYTFGNVTANHTIAVTFTWSTSASTYTITASSGANGTVSPAGASSVASGTAKTYTITPNSGYRVASVLVDGASVGAVTTYTFGNVTANHTIAATFSAVTTSVGIIGYSGEGTTTDYISDSSGSYISATRFRASANLNVTTIRAKVSGITGKYKAAIYSDNNGVPQTLLKASAEVANPATGWQTFALSSSQSIVSGNYYWLAIWSSLKSMSARIYTDPSGATTRWTNPLTYGTWPNPISTTDGGSYKYCIYGK